MLSVVINNQARIASRHSDQINKVLAKHKIVKERIYLIDDANKLADCLESLKGSEKVIVGGGDGSILAAVNTFAGSKTALGVLPLGTGNNFAQVLETNPDPIVTLAALLESETTRSVHLGKANDTYFSSMTTVGVSAQLNKEIDDKLKSRYGVSAYAIEGVRQLKNHKSFTADIVVDGKSESFETHEIIIANTALKLPFNWNIDFELDREELLIVSLSKTASRIKQIQGLFKLINNTPDEDMMLETGKSIEITTKPEHRPYECDGEHIGDTPLKVSFEKDALTVIQPVTEAELSVQGND